MVLEKEVQQKRKEYRTDSYSMSYGEIISMYQNREIDINPDFQRYYRWSNTQKSRFIESLLLGIPTPSIFVYQRNDGIWELVDGLQRISTILEFVGELREEKSKKKPPLALEKTKMLPGLKGIMWNHPKNKVLSLAAPLQLDIKRSKVIVQIIQKESDPDSKFEVFQRLNTGGSFLSEQEVRNCLLIMMNKELYNWLKRLAENKHFLKCIAISDRLMQQQYNMELVLRYLSCYHYKYDRSEVSEFLTESLNSINKNRSFNFEGEEKIFNKLFTILDNSLGDNTFTKYDKGSFKGKFLESAYEAVTVGLRYNINSYSHKGDETLIAEKIKGMWSDPRFLNYSGSGSNARVRIPRLIKFGQEFFRNGQNE